MVLLLYMLSFHVTRTWPEGTVPAWSLLVLESDYLNALPVPTLFGWIT